jgi:hypothetical protein
MLRESRLWVLVLGLVGLFAVQVQAKTPGPDPTLVNPVGLGSNYTGPVRAGLGITHTDTLYGISAGEFVIQPRFLMETELTSNFFKVDTRNEGTEETLAFNLHLRPGVGISNPNASSVKLSFTTDLDVFVPLSGEDVLTDQTNVGVESRAAVTFTLKRLMSFTLKENFWRDLLVRPLSAGGGESHRNRNSVGLDMTFHPGGGALVFEVGYDWEIVLYDSLIQLDDNQHKVRFLTSWRFLPLNYAFLEATLGIQSYLEDLTSEEATTTGNRVAGMPVRVYGGFSGYLTERMAVMLRVGYGNSLLDSGDDFSSFIGDMRFSFRFSPRTALHVGGGRSFSLAGLGGFLDTSGAYVSFEQSLADLVLLHLDVGFDYQVYGEWSPANSQSSGGDGPDYQTCARAVLEGSSEGGDFSLADCDTKTDLARQDYVLKAGLLADFEISRAFGVSLGYRFHMNMTDFGVESVTFQDFGAGIVDTVAGPSTVFQGYTDHRVFLTLNLRY